MWRVLPIIIMEMRQRNKQEITRRLAIVFTCVFVLTTACNGSDETAGSSQVPTDDATDSSSDTLSEVPPSEDSSETSSEGFSEGSAEASSANSAEETSQELADATLFDGIYDISEVAGADIAVPLTNGWAVARVSDALIGFFADAGDGYLLRLANSGEITTALLARGISPGTLAASEDNVLAVYQFDSSSEHQMKAYWSTDGGETGSHLVLGDRGVGAAVPSACLWREGAAVKGLVAWVTPPTEDDRGPLYVVEMTNGVVGTPTQIGTDEGFSAPSLSCSDAGQFMAVRNQPETDAEIAIYFGKRIGETFVLEEVFKGADPSLCAAGDHAWVGSHRGAQVNLSHTTDGGTTWETVELDDSARYASVGCYDDMAIAIYGDWPDTATAMNHDNATRQVTGKFLFSGADTFVTHTPVDTDVFQGPATVIMDSAGIAIVLRDTDRQVVRVVID